MVTTAGWAPTLSIEAERAIRDLNRLRVVVGRAQLAVGVIPSRAGAERRDVAEIGIVRAFSVLESYLSARADLPVPDPPRDLPTYAHSRLLGSFRGDFVRGPVEFWRVGLSVDLEKFPGGWKRLDEYRELRNVLTHGLGYVRPGPTKLKASIRKRIARVTTSPDTYAGRVPLDASEFDEIARLVHEFVVWADVQRA
jgi:hypothetical protein